MSRLYQLIKNDNGYFYYENVKAPNINSRAVRVEMQYASICGTDIDIVRNARNDSARVLGHEGAGVIAMVGDEVSNFRVGDKVCFNPVNPFNQNDILGHSYDGVFSSYIDINPEHHPEVLFKLPSEYDIERAPLIEPLSVAVYCHEILAGPIKEIEDILIIGTGGISHLLSIYFSRLGHCVDMYSISNKSMYMQSEDRYPKENYKLVFICTARKKADEALVFAEKIVSDGGIIHSISGFNLSEKEPTYTLRQQLSSVRRDNYCGRNTKLIRFQLKNKSIYLSGQRGSGYEHFKKASEELIKESMFFDSIIKEKISFIELGDYLNHIKDNNLLHRGKTLIKFSKDDLSE